MFDRFPIDAQSMFGILSIDVRLAIAGCFLDRGSIALDRYSTGAPHAFDRCPIEFR